MNHDELKQWAMNANCHDAIAEAIHYAAQGVEPEMNRIWQDPTEPEFLAVWERATNNGLVDDSEMFWGESRLSYLRENLFT